MTDYQHILWDFNGTLMDDAWLCLEVMNKMLAQRGFPGILPEQYAEIFDFPVEGYYQRAGWDLEKYPFEQLSDEFMAGYHARKLECGLHSGSREVLSRLQADGIPQSVISAAEQSMVVDLLNHYQIEQFFSSVRGLDNHHAAGKTAIGVQYVQQLGIEPQKILLVGDTVHDFQVAQAMGTDCVLVSSGHHSRQRLEATGARVYDRLDQIIF
jgi:phosphoglycolate phosphatase